MKLNSSGAWKLDLMKLQSIGNKFLRGLLTSGALVGVVTVLQNTIMPELTAINSTLAAVVGIILAEVIESLSKLSKDYSK